MNASLPGWLKTQPSLVILASLALVLGVPAARATEPGSLPTDAPPLNSLDVSVPLPEELQELKEIGESVADRLKKIDPEVIRQAVQPLSRQALQVFWDIAPDLSRRAVARGDRALEDLSQRALEALEKAQADFERSDSAARSSPQPR